jgi:hypothetical protein
MARSPDWEKLAMAQGDPKPTWPMPTVKPKFATWSVGGGRPSACTEDKCERWHAGIDLTNAPDGALIVAPEDALVVGIDRGWSEGAKAAFLRTNTGLFLVLGGFKQGSHKQYGIKEGQAVRKGDKLGVILGSYGMVHLETYEAEDRKANSVWWKDEPPPDGLLNPANYVERMVGRQGFAGPDAAAPRGAPGRSATTRATSNAAWGTTSTDALRAAQQSLGVEVDGKWGPNTEDAIQRALIEKQGCTADECSADTGDESADNANDKSDALAGVGRLGWVVIGGVALVGVALGAAATFRRDL